MSGTAEPGASVVVSAAGRTWNVTANDAGTWSALLDGLPAGATQVTATQTDVAGNSSPAAAPQEIVLATPSADLRLFRIDLSGEPGATVALDIDGAVSLHTLDAAGAGRETSDLLRWWLASRVEV